MHQWNALCVACHADASLHINSNSILLALENKVMMTAALSAMEDAFNDNNKEDDDEPGSPHDGERACRVYCARVYRAPCACCVLLGADAGRGACLLACCFPPCLVQQVPRTCAFVDAVDALTHPPAPTVATTLSPNAQTRVCSRTVHGPAPICAHAGDIQGAISYNVDAGTFFLKTKKRSYVVSSRLGDWPQLIAALPCMPMQPKPCSLAHAAGL